MHVKPLHQIREELLTLLTMVNHISLVFDECKYDLIIAAINYLKEMVELDNASIAAVRQKMTQIGELLNHMAYINHCAGCNYISERFDTISAHFMEEKTSSNLPS